METFVLHPLWRQLMETVLFRTLCRRQMGPLGLCINDIHFTSTHICRYYINISLAIYTQLHRRTEPRFIPFLTSNCNFFHWPHYIVPSRMVLLLVSWLTTVSLLSSVREMVLHKPWSWFKLIGYYKRKPKLAKHSGILVEIHFISLTYHLISQGIGSISHLICFNKIFIPQLYEVIPTLERYTFQIVRR